MLSLKRLALVALLLAVALASSSVRCTEEKSSETLISKTDDFGIGDEAETFDYEFDENEQGDVAYSTPDTFSPPPLSNYPPPAIAYALPSPPSNYLPPPPPPPVYHPVPLPNYSMPYVHYQAQQNYPPPVVIPPQNYTTPYANHYVPTPVLPEQLAPITNYSPPIPPPIIYAPHNNYSSGPPAYQPPATPPPPPVVSQVYSAPPPPPPVVSQVYSAPPPPPPAPVTYAPPAPVSYAPPPPPPAPPVVHNYSAPASPHYAPPTAPSYPPPSPPPPAVANYSAPPPPPPPAAYGPQHGPNYVPAPIVRPHQPFAIAPYAPKGNYSVGPYHPAPPPAGHNGYSLADLAPLVSPAGYQSNHWSFHYYRASPYRLCPKNNYMHPPGPRDIEAAFAFAQTVLGVARGASIQYMNSSQPSFAARHQVFSYLSQQSARMDEEGLLLELVSEFLSERACLTKWDKQRYLPTLTKFISTGNFPAQHSCSNLYQLQNGIQANQKYCAQSKYRTLDGFCNNPYHPYWGKSNVCHIRLLSPDYADGISDPRVSYNPRLPLPNPRLLSNIVHNDIPLEGPYNLMKMQWGQFINHDITNTALSSYDGLVDCCKNPNVPGCFPIYVPPGDRFYSRLNVTCLNFIRSGVCPTCQLGPRQQFNKNTAFLDASHIYGNTLEQANQLRAFRRGLLKVSLGKTGDQLLPIATSKGQEQCSGICYHAGDARVNQHPALTVLHTLLLRNHNRHATALAQRHPEWNDETLYQESRRLVIAEYQMITFAEYLPIVFGPVLSAYYHLIPQKHGHTYYDPKVDPTTWNEYATASCRFGHSQISSTFGMYNQLFAHGQHDPKQPSFRLREWFMRPSLLNDGLLPAITLGLLGKPAMAVDPWVTDDVRNHLYQSHKDLSGGDLVATNIQRGREHGIPSYVQYVEYCFNMKVRSWKDLSLFIPPFTLNQLRKYYKVVEHIDLFTGGVSERHFPGADIGPTFACINGIQYYHLKFGDRFYFEHGGQAGSFNPAQLEEIKRTTLARLLCHTANVQTVPAYAFLQASHYNPIVNCSHIGDLNYNLF